MLVRFRKALERLAFFFIGAFALVWGIGYLFDSMSGTNEITVLQQIAALLVILVGIIAAGVWAVITRLDREAQGNKDEGDKFKGDESRYLYDKS